jgi:hypothetical protein
VTWQRHLARILFFSLAHFAIAMTIAIAAFGTDMDQLRSRTALSRAAGNIHDVLWWPHDTALRALPNDFVSHHTYVIPIALVLNSLVWGSAAYAVTRAGRKLR